MNTTKAQHTPGPWKVCHSSDNGIYIGIERLGQNAAVIASLTYNDFYSQAEANACLIAQSPNLLKSLKQTVESLEYWFKRYGDPEGANSEMMKQAREAISKAEGNQK